MAKVDELEKPELEGDAEIAQTSLTPKHPDYGLVGNSEEIEKVRKLIEKADGDFPVLISGETGTGKELVAEAIHKCGERRGKPYVVVDCAALHPELVNSELFGHKKGAFTGAVEDKTGLLEMADGGTIFFDEVENMRPSNQAMLLRVLEGKRFRRVGSGKDTESDFRVVAATNQDLEGLIKDGKFRSDLYYRLNVYPIQIPPLRERRVDIYPLVAHFLNKIRSKIPIDNISLEAGLNGWLRNYEFPGNVRELENIVIKIDALGIRGFLENPPSTLLPYLKGGLSSSKEESGGYFDGAIYKRIAHNYPALAKSIDLKAAVNLATALLDREPLQLPLIEFEKIIILMALEQLGGNKKRAAKSLGTTSQRVQRKLHKYGIPPNFFRYSGEDGRSVFKTAQDSISTPAGRKSEYSEPNIRRALEIHSGNTSAAARSLGMNPKYIHQVLKRLGINPWEYKDGRI